jgi:hypothetical protein
MKSCARAMLIAAMLFPWWEIGRATAQEGADPDKRIGILLAAGDIAACYHKDRKYKEVSELIQREVDKAAHLPLAVLVLGDVAYANPDKKSGKSVPPFYAEYFKEF